MTTKLIQDVKRGEIVEFSKAATGIIGASVLGTVARNL